MTSARAARFRLHTGLTADCTHLDVDVEKYAAFLQDASTLPQAQIDALNREDRNLKMTRPAFGGHLMATIICPRFRPQMATVRPGVLKKGEYNEAKANAVVVEPVALFCPRLTSRPRFSRLLRKLRSFGLT